MASKRAIPTNVTGSLALTAKKLAGNDSREAEGSDDAGQQSEANEEHAVARDELQDAARLRAQGHADSDFAGTLRDAVGHHSVNAHGSEKQRQQAEAAQQLQCEAPLRQRIGKKIAHRPGIVKRHAFVERCNLLLDVAGEIGTIEVAANDEDRIAERILRIELVDLRRDWRIEAVVMNVSDDAHNR